MVVEVTIVVDVVAKVVVVFFPESANVFVSEVSFVSNNTFIEFVPDGTFVTEVCLQLVFAKYQYLNI